MKRIATLGGLCCVAMLVLASSAPALSFDHLTVGAKAGAPLSVARLTAPTPACVGADDPTASIVEQEGAMKCMLNYARKRAGLPSLGDMRKLDASSAGKVGDILRCGQFTHQACRRDFLFWFRRSGYLPRQCWTAGENLAWGVGGMGAIRSVVKAWLRSPSHRSNILSPSFDEFGVSLRVGDLAGAKDAHVWVNHFGRHC